MDKFIGILSNILGTIQWRHGKMFKMPKNKKDKLISDLKPLDIILEKTPFRLTDKFIPGYWGFD